MQWQEIILVARSVLLAPDSHFYKSIHKLPPSYRYAMDPVTTMLVD